MCTSTCPIKLILLILFSCESTELYASGPRSQDVVSLANTFKKDYLWFLESYVLKLFLVKQPNSQKKIPNLLPFSETQWDYSSSVTLKIIDYLK